MRAPAVTRGFELAERVHGALFRPAVDGLQRVRVVGEGEEVRVWTVAVTCPAAENRGCGRVLEGAGLDGCVVSFRGV